MKYFLSIVMKTLCDTYFKTKGFNSELSITLSRTKQASIITFISTCPLVKWYGNYVCLIVTVACPNSKENKFNFYFLPVLWTSISSFLLVSIQFWPIGTNRISLKVEPCKIYIYVGHRPINNILWEDGYRKLFLPSCVLIH